MKVREWLTQNSVYLWSVGKKKDKIKDEPTESFIKDNGSSLSLRKGGGYMGLTFWWHGS